MAAETITAIIGKALLTKALGATWDKAAHKDKLQKLVNKWKDSFQNEDDGEDKLNAAFEEFFADQKVLDEVEKVGYGRYRDVDFGALAALLEERFTWAGCAERLPKDVYAEVASWFGDLRALLEEKGPLPEPRQPQPGFENDSLARKAYLESVVRQHCYIRFSGMAVVDKRTEVEMARVFVMPRVKERGELIRQGDKWTEEVKAAYKLFAGKKAARRVVILGGPGSGKTTLLEAFTLAFANRKEFAWAHGLPDLLPIFYRVRDLEQDLQTHQTIWDCVQHQCSRRLGRTLPREFFKRQMAVGGLLVLFDGLDEAGTVARRNEMVDFIAEFAEGLSAESRVVITSRPHDYRYRFDERSYAHVELSEFNDDEIQSFIQGWQGIHEPDKAAAQEKGEVLWKALEGGKDILPLARNALLLTMIVRVHFGLGALPGSRLGLYAKCTETLLEHWAEPKGLERSPIDSVQKNKLLQRLAFEMQGEAETLEDGMVLQIARGDLTQRFRMYLDDESCPDAFHLVEKVVHRLHARDAILVQYGTDARGQDLFGFVHRSFQEYFAARWMVQELEEAEFARQLAKTRQGWNETLYLAVAQLDDRRRRKTLLGLLKTGRAEFAVECLRAAPPEQQWLRMLVQFLARYTWGGKPYLEMSAANCADACAGRSELWDVLEKIFLRENREGQSLAAAVDLTECLAERGEQKAQNLLTDFFAEAEAFSEDTVLVEGGAFPYGEERNLVDVAAFRMDRFPVTNVEYERMVPGHKRMRDEYSDADDQPVIYVSWFEARLYCRWGGAASGCRLSRSGRRRRVGMRLRKRNGFTLGEMTSTNRAVIRLKASEGRRVRWMIIRRVTVLAGAPTWQGMFGSGRIVATERETSELEWRGAARGSALVDSPLALIASPTTRRTVTSDIGFRCART